MGCGTVLNLGQSYLLFISGARSFDQYASGALKGKVARTRQLQQSLEILRDYRDGKIDDLADPWSFADSGLSCDLRHEVSGQEISFTYPYSDRFAEYGWSIEYDEDGRITGVSTSPIDSSIGRDVEVVIEGPQIGPGDLLFAARFDPAAKTVRDSATIQVEQQSWNLSTQVVTLRTDDRDLTQPIVTDIAWGADSRDILQAMLETRDVVVLKTRSGTSDGSALPAGDDLHVSIETRTTQIGAEASKFLACIDGSVRGSPSAGAQ